MQPIRHEPEYVKGLEILTFDQVELEKVREGGAHTFATLGNLSVFYFDYFERFLLRLNNWQYCLLPKLHSSASAGQAELGSHNFVIPAHDGTYTLKLGQVQNSAALQNFETILSGATKFSREGQEEQTGRQVDVALGEFTASQMIYTNQPGHIIERSQEMGFSSYPSTTQSTLSSDAKKSKSKGRLSKLKQKFKRKPKNIREPNLNMTQIRDFLSIKATPETMVNVVEFKREEIENAIVSTKEIVKKLETPPTIKEEIKEKVIGLVDVIKEGVHDIKEKIAERHEHEAQTGEKIGIMQIVKEGIHEMKDKLTGKHLDEGEIEPIDDQGRKKMSIASALKAGVHEVKAKLAERNAHNEAGQTKPGIIETVKNSVNDFKGRAAARHELTGAPGEKVGIIDLVKEGVLEIKEKLAKKGPEETIVTERVETFVPGTGLNPGIIQTQETQLGHIVINEPPRVYDISRTHEGRLKIFDDRYLDQPLHSQPFPLSGNAGKDMVLHYEEYSKHEHKTEGGVTYKVDNSHLSILDKVKASLHFSGKSDHLEVKETYVPEGHAPSNLTDRLKDMIHLGKSNTNDTQGVQSEAKPGIVDQVKSFFTGAPTQGSASDRAHSPVKKRELIKAALPLFCKGVQPEEEEEGGRLTNIAKAGGIIGIAQTGGLSGITNTAIPMLMKKNHDEKKVEVHSKDNVPQSVPKHLVRTIDPLSARLAEQEKTIHQTPIHEEPNIQRHLPGHFQPTSNLNATDIHQVYQETLPIQSRIVERRVERPLNPQSQNDSQLNNQIYEANITHYQG